jgi:hypothetical protein
MRAFQKQLSVFLLAIAAGLASSRSRGYERDSESSCY